MKAINEIGNKYGLLRVLSRAENDRHGKAQWLCECECGKQIIVGGASLRKGNTKTCGCRRLSAETAEIGKRYGSLVVEECIGRTEAKKLIWKCKCDCGKYTQATTGHLHSGLIKTCGHHCGGKNIVNEIGNIYGKLTVIARASVPDTANSTQAYWECECECGNHVVVCGTHLRTGNTASCGCVSSRGEYNIIQILNGNKINYRTQYSFEDLKFKSYLRYDFAILDENNTVIRLIEFDGPQHIPGNQWNNNEVIFRDMMKNEYAKTNSIPLVRIPYSKRDTMTLEDILSDKYLLK